MKHSYLKIAEVVLLIMLIPLTSASQAGHNEIGIYTTETPDVSTLEDFAMINGVAGVLYTAYVVCLNPYNETLDRPISMLGCAEFRLEWGDLVVNYDLPPASNIFTNPPDFMFCSYDHPVVNGMCTLLTLHIGSYTAEPAAIHIMPVMDYPQSIEGGLAVTDQDDQHSMHQAYPSSGDFENPIFGFNLEVVSDQATSWSGVKSLYR